jgi:uncharacterized protein (TIGR02391 family)
VPEELEPLVLRFDPQTVEHLGAKMYSHLPNAVAELVANAYDADARFVTVAIGSDASVRVEDDGHGMSREDLAEKYLRIGRNRRSDTASDTTESGDRKVSGKKGLGKLALFGIGRTVELNTKRIGSDLMMRVQLSYDDMMGASGTYAPTESSTPSDPNHHGTSVTLRELKRKSPIDPGQLAVSLSRLFSYADTNFVLAVVGPDDKRYEVTPELRLGAVDQEFEWALPDSLGPDDGYLVQHAVKGRIVSARKPLGQELRGVTLYAHGRLVNEPEFFGASESSFAYQYLTGYLEVDFVDELASDVIATDRRALDWDLEDTSDLREALRVLITRVGQEWRQRRREASEIAKAEQIGTTTSEWVNSVKSPERDPLAALVGAIESEELNIEPEQQIQLLQEVRKLAPDNAEYVWRHLHSEVQTATKNYYDTGHYWTAVDEAIKRYITLTAAKASLPADRALDVVTSAFGKAGKLKVLHRLYGGHGFTDTTLGDMQDGQKHLSMGIVAAFRNPISHTELETLKATDAMTYQDCLDALGIISHLMRRLDDSAAGP